jgi:hypothetical protein
LMAQPAGQSKFEAFAEADNKFFLKRVDVTLEFVREGDGPATGVILRQGGSSTEGKRIDN